MKLLCFADVHADAAALSSLLRKAKKADFLICAGDLSVFGSKLEQSMKYLQKAGKPMLIIPGNHETTAEIAEASKKIKNVVQLHKQIYTANGVLFFGYGSGGFSIYEPEMERFAKKLRDKLPQDVKKVFVTHAPPYNTPIDYIPWLKEHCGCKSVVKAIRLLKPDLVVCGHIHETAKKSCKIGKTLAINPGRSGKIINLE